MYDIPRNWIALPVSLTLAGLIGWFVIPMHFAGVMGVSNVSSVLDLRKLLRGVLFLIVWSVFSCAVAAMTKGFGLDMSISLEFILLFGTTAFCVWSYRNTTPNWLANVIERLCDLMPFDYMQYQ